MTNTYPTYRFLLWAFISLFISYLFIGCNKDKQTEETNVPNNKPTDSTSTNSINVRFAPGGVLSEAEIQAILHDKIPKLTADSVKVRSCPCDSTLANIKLPQSWTIIKGQDPVQLIVKSDPAGAGMSLTLTAGAITGINYDISTGDDVFNKELPQYDPTVGSKILTQKDSKQTIKVAVFDSGLENPSILTHYLPEELLVKTYMCTKGTIDRTLSTKRGWNFINDNPVTVTYDTYKGLHGSRVTHLLAKQFNGIPATPQIVPMRVLDKNNNGDLFGLMCAMETARLNDVKVFNMSLGYYGEEDSLFKSYVKKAVNNGIWLVTAAGNQPIPLASTMVLSTMKPKFYPAYFNKEFSKVLIATTALKLGNAVKASGYQNYDKTMTWGVRADIIDGNKGIFVIASSERVFGTSFATPILAGWVAAKLAQSPTFIPGSLSSLPSVATGGQVIKNAYLTPVP